MTHHMRDQLVNWLNDALAMEEGLVQVLTNHANDAKSYPPMRQMIEQHIDQTKHHAELVRQRIQDLGGSPSTMKSTIGKVQGFFQGVSTGAAGDELVKNCLADYASEQFEVACYTALIEAARSLGDSQTMSMCQQICSEDQAMAERLFNSLPTVVTNYMSVQQQKAA